jgi:hypothetical protein
MGAGGLPMALFFTVVEHQGQGNWKFDSSKFVLVPVAVNIFLGELTNIARYRILSVCKIRFH